MDETLLRTIILGTTCIALATCVLLLIHHNVKYNKTINLKSFQLDFHLFSGKTHTMEMYWVKVHNYIRDKGSTEKGIRALADLTDVKATSVSSHLNIDPNDFIDEIVLDHDKVNPFMLGIYYHRVVGQDKLGY